MLHLRLSRLLPLPAGFLALALTTGTSSADWRTDVGWDDFKTELGGGYPDGTGVLVVQSEADESGAAGLQYIPNPASAEMTGKTISPQAAGDNSSHALSVGRRFFGNLSSMAPDVTDIDVYDANGYLGAIGSISSTRKVHSCAWVGDFSSNAALNLGTLDSAIDTKGFLVVGGLNNGTVLPVPHLFATTYNAISVGRSSGGHSRGGTILGGYGFGRTKPEVVLPEAATSYSTGGVCSLAAVLYDVAATSGHTNAEDNSEVMKAIIMAGATKQEFNSWDRTLTRPIDDIFGAGEVNILNSYHILDAGEQSPGSAASTGWDYNFISDPGGPNDFTSRSYDFTIPDKSWADDFSVVVNWNYAGSGTARDLKLELFSLTGGTTLLDDSDSTVDNVEHVYQRNLPPGDYRITVSRSDANDDQIDYAVAWEAQLGDGPRTTTAESLSNLPEVTVTNIFKNQPYVIERSLDLQSWTVVHSFTPTTWADYAWEDPAGFPVGTEVFYRSGFTR